MILPDSWTTVSIGNVCTTSSGGTPSRGNSLYFTGTIPWVKSGELNYNTIFKTEEYISENAIEKSSAKLLPEGTLLIALYGATVGKLAFLGIKAATNQAVCAIIPPDFLSNKYLYHILFFRKGELLDKRVGGAQPNISQGILREVQFPLPPLPEQLRIVAKIEELFSDLDAGIASLRKAKEQLKIYRRSVLKWAFEGKFTSATVGDEALPEGWRWEYTKELFEYVTSGSRGWAQYYSDEGAIFLRMGNLDHDSIDLDLTDIQRVKLPNKAEGTRTLVRTGDILISITADVGMIALVPENFPEAYINQHVSLARPKINIVQPSYLAWFLAGKENGQKQLRDLQRGATKVGLGLDDIRSVKVPIPPIKEQSAIVSEIESRLSVADNLEKSIDASLTQADALRQSILKRAFEGKLVPQDPKDQPASELLNRIIQEKATKELPQKGKRRNHKNS